MQRSSEEIGNIAAALARAQADIINPEKSMTAVVRSPFPREEDRTFRYAPLSAGLEIVRKALGRQEIATIQTTSIDTQTNLIRLTTMLAHSSGEWMSSDWPVCPVSETSAPHKMGAALTYARRYALFTIVGIAGEDDLDAPETASTDQPVAQIGASQRPKSAKPSSSPALPASKLLTEDASAKLREQLIAELAALQSAEQTSSWALRSLPLKSTLTAEDACALEAAFSARLSEIEPRLPEQDPATADVTARRTGASPDVPAAAPAVQRNGHAPSRSFAKVPRTRDKEHRRFVAGQACLICGRTPCDAHHIRFAQPSSLGRKVSDEFTVPLCRTHHRALHRTGREEEWWQAVKINPLQVAGALWQQTRVIERHIESPSRG